jgi:hypothetical protein
LKGEVNQSEEMGWYSGMLEQGRGVLGYIRSYLAKGSLVVLVGFILTVLLTTTWNGENVRTTFSGLDIFFFLKW